MIFELLRQGNTKKHDVLYTGLSIHAVTQGLNSKPGIAIFAAVNNLIPTAIDLVRIEKIILPEFPLLLAPMEDVSDPPLRSVCKDEGADLMYTEFISSEGLIRDAIKCRRKLDIFEEERPVGIQI